MTTDSRFGRTFCKLIVPVAVIEIRGFALSSAERSAQMARRSEPGPEEPRRASLVLVTASGSVVPPGVPKGLVSPFGPLTRPSGGTPSSPQHSIRFEV